MSDYICEVPKALNGDFAIVKTERGLEEQEWLCNASMVLSQARNHQTISFHSKITGAVNR